MMREIPRLETVGEQPVERRVVRHAQQRFRQRHDREPLARGEREFVQKVLDAADPAAPRPRQSEQFARQILRRGGDLRAGFRREQVLRKRLVGRRIGRGEDWNILWHDGSRRHCAMNGWSRASFRRDARLQFKSMRLWENASLASARLG